MKKVLSYLKTYKKECILGPLFKLLEASFELVVPLIIASVVDIGISNQDVPYVIRMSIYLLVLAIVGLTCSLTAQWFAAKAATGFSAKLRHDLFKHIKSLGYKEIDNLGTATMITRMTSDVNQVQNGVNLALRLLLRSPFVVIGAMVMAFTIDVKSALVFAVLIPVLCLVVFGLMLWTMPIYKKVQSNLDNVTKSCRENLSGVRVIRAFCREKEEIDNFKKDTSLLTSMQKYVAKISALLNPVTFISVNIAIIALLWTGAIKVDEGALTQGQVLALYNYMCQILVELIKTADLIVSMTKAGACANRINSVFELEPSQKDGTFGEIQEIQTIEFKNVDLKYYKNSDPAIENVSFKVRKGQTIGVIGGTGSGKTSLISLIPRFYDATTGKISFNDININDYTIENLRDKIAIVPQKSVLFAGTIESNLLWGKNDATIQQMNTALDLAQAKDFVYEKDGLKTVVSQGGRNFSGGQRQRLAIARALVKSPEILILDDSASALDYETDSKLRKAIKNMENPPITFIASQRAVSVINSDLILVLYDGKVVGQGTHSELINTCETYQEIYYSQFQKQEVAKIER
ncbi:MAG: ABC transporter ATP-binding protein [Clostridia bacterium]